MKIEDLKKFPIHFESEGTVSHTAYMIRAIYESTGNPFLGLVTDEDIGLISVDNQGNIEELMPSIDISVNLDGWFPEHNEIVIDVNNNPQGIIQAVEKTDIIKYVSGSIPFGLVSYPIYELNMNMYSQLPNLNDIHDEYDQ